MRQTAAVITPETATKPTQLVLPWRKQDEKVFERAVDRERQVHVARAQKLKELAEIAPRCTSVVHPVQTYPSIYVRVPRAVFEYWWPQPWAEVLVAAEHDIDGLEVLRDQPRVWRGTVGEGEPDPADVAYLAEGQDDWRGRTVLFQQNW
jgi:hypothetical protein